MSPSFQNAWPKICEKVKAGKKVNVALRLTELDSEQNSNKSLDQKGLHVCQMDSSKLMISYQGPSRFYTPTLYCVQLWLKFISDINLGHLVVP